MGGGRTEKFTPNDVMEFWIPYMSQRAKCLINGTLIGLLVEGGGSQVKYVNTELP